MPCLETQLLGALSEAGVRHVFSLRAASLGEDLRTPHYVLEAVSPAPDGEVRHNFRPVYRHFQINEVNPTAASLLKASDK